MVALAAPISLAEEINLREKSARTFCLILFNMTDTAAVSAAPAKASSPKKAKSGPKKPKTTPSHPPVASMVNAAIKNLKERGGSSSQAIKKYIAANNKCDVEKLAPFIKRYLKSAVAKGLLVQTKGKGASGSFKLKEKTAAKAAKPKKATATKKKTAASGEKKPKTPKKKKTTTKKASGEKKPKTPKKTASKKPKAAKKATKPKTPKKPKVVKKSSPKKAKKVAAKK